MSAHHTLRAKVGTVHRGVFDATLAPVLTIASGDVVDVTTLSGNPDQIPPPELGFTVLPEHRDVLARVPKGEGPHLLTGPIAVDGAMPGDELVVEVLDMKLAQDWGWNRFAPGMGALPEQFPDARCIHIAIDRSAATVTLPWGLKLKAAPFFGIIGVAPPPAMGRIVNIASGTAFKGTPNFLHYVASKGAVVSMTRSLARELGPYNICVNAIAPGLTMSEAVVTNPDWTGKASAAGIAARAIQREQVPADLISTLIYFCSDASNFITGQTISVDGGALMR
jgi:hypothetical protein